MPLSAAAILNPDGFDTGHADGSVGPAQLPPEYRDTDAAYWYRRWLFLARMLDEEAEERIAHYVNFDRKLLEAADAARAVREYGQQMSGGGWDIWNTADYVLKIYPLAGHIEAIQRHGAVYRRTIIVVQDWKRLRKGAKS